MVKWDAANDQLLLMKILEIHNFTPDYKAMSAAWPTGGNEAAPTAKAISERIFKIRKTVGKNGASNSATPAQAKTPKSTPATPRRAPASGSSITKTPASKKRKFKKSESEDEDSENNSTRINPRDLPALEPGTPTPVRTVSRREWVNNAASIGTPSRALTLAAATNIGTPVSRMRRLSVSASPAPNFRQKVLERDNIHVGGYDGNASVPPVSQHQKEQEQQKLLSTPKKQKPAAASPAAAKAPGATPNAARHEAVVQQSTTPIRVRPQRQRKGAVSRYNEMMKRAGIDVDDVDQEDADMHTATESEYEEAV